MINKRLKLLCFNIVMVLVAYCAKLLELPTIIMNLAYMSLLIGHSSSRSARVKLSEDQKYSAVFVSTMLIILLACTHSSYQALIKLGVILTTSIDMRESYYMIDVIVALVVSAFYQSFVLDDKTEDQAILSVVYTLHAYVKLTFVAAALIRYLADTFEQGTGMVHLMYIAIGFLVLSGIGQRYFKKQLQYVKSKSGSDKSDEVTNNNN